MKSGQSAYSFMALTLIAGWWLGSALAASVVLDPERAMALRIGVGLACFAAAVSAPGLLMRRAAALNTASRRRMVFNLFGGGFWALGFGVGMTAFYAVTGSNAEGRPDYGSSEVLIFLLPPSAALFAAAQTVLQERFGEAGDDEDAAA